MNLHNHVFRSIHGDDAAARCLSGMACNNDVLVLLVVHENGRGIFHLRSPVLSLSHLPLVRPRRSSLLKSSSIDGSTARTGAGGRTPTTNERKDDDDDRGNGLSYDFPQFLLIMQEICLLFICKFHGLPASTDANALPKIWRRGRETFLHYDTTLNKVAGKLNQLTGR